MSFFVDLIFISAAVIAFCCSLIVLQFTVERFLTQTLPVIVDIYARIRYPEDYK